ncbi:hypothetical protein MRB53_019970 [Persea americana]|uniref:Uncharacterized protein n=1 Tax=Persea americana TaxID=3435 RepID=A0ACC2L081_PERAE|nr:hypothetical protein MRB53_019970 [Persea americana]
MGCSVQEEEDGESGSTGKKMEPGGDGLYSNSSVLGKTDVESYRHACLKNCSCKAALFRYDENILDSGCFLHSELFSLVNEPTGCQWTIMYNSSAFIKVQIPSSSASPNLVTREEMTLPPSSKKPSPIAKVVGSILVALPGAFLIISTYFALVRKNGVKEEEEDCFGQKLEYPQLEESVHLLSLVKRNAEDDQLHCIIDKLSEDMQLHLDEAVKMIKLGVCYLQSDFNIRPSMSMVVKVLEGVVEMEPSLDYTFLALSPAIAHTRANLGISTP